MAVSVVIVAYNAGDKLGRCLDALEGERETLSEVIVVNNGARGPEIDAAAARELVALVEPGENLGFAGGSNAGAERARGEVLLFLNPDTVVQRGALARLADALRDETVGIVMAKLRLLDDPDRLNSAGCVIHVTGLAWSDRYGEPADALRGLVEITYANGSALAIRADLFRRLGGFTPELFTYHEDLELGWRVRMKGLRVVLDAEADVLHDYEYGRNPTKSYFMERNRLIFLLTSYSGRLLFVLAPVLVSAEAGLWVTAIAEGWFRDKAAGWSWCARNARWLRRHRRRIQASRRVPDRELARFLTPVFDPRMIDVPGAVRLANPFVRAYWSLARRVL